MSTAAGTIENAATAAAGFGHAQILDAIPHPIMLIAADGAVVFANPSAELFFGAG